MTLKCNICNLVISELLAYVQNKLSVVDEDSLVRICASTFSSEQIEEAKNLLVDSLPADLRKTTRRGKGKENRVLNDIISLFKSTDPDVLPVFVARDLDKLPPITFDSLDVSKLLKDLVIVQAEIKNIKSSYVTIDQLEEMKRECQNFKHTSPPFSAVKVNMRRGAYRDSGPIGLSQFDDTIVTNHSDPNVEASSPSDFNLKYRSINCMEGKSQRSVVSGVSSGECVRAVQRGSGMAAGAGAGGTSIASSRECGEGGTVAAPRGSGEEGDVSSQTVSKRSTAPVTKCASARSEPTGVLSFAEIMRTEGEWKVVQRRKPKTKPYRYLGSAGVSTDKDSLFKAAERKIPIFITKVHKETTEKHIADYIRNKTNETIMLEKIVFRNEREYNAYKFFVSEQKLAIFLDDKLWPKGIIFRRFINFRPKNMNGDSVDATRDIPARSWIAD